MTWLDQLLSENHLGCLPRWDATLEALCCGLPPEDAQVLREERVAIMEVEGGLSRREAEARCRVVSMDVL